MSDADNLYDQHDNLEERASALRAQFNADAKEFGGWDAEEDEIDTRLNGIGERLKRLHDHINDIEQIEIDRLNSVEQEEAKSLEHAKDLIVRAQRQIAELDEDIGILGKDIDDWRDRNTPDDDD